MLRSLQVARRSDSPRTRLRRLSRPGLVATAAAFRPCLPLTTPTAAAQLALKSLAVRHRQLSAEVDALEKAPCARCSQPVGLPRLIAISSTTDPSFSAHFDPSCLPVLRSEGRQDLYAV